MSPTTTAKKSAAKSAASKKAPTKTARGSAGRNGTSGRGGSGKNGNGTAAKTKARASAKQPASNGRKRAPVTRRMTAEAPMQRKAKPGGDDGCRAQGTGADGAGG